jgi:hypothetical protein
MTTITVDISALVDGQNADAGDVITPVSDLKNAIQDILNGVKAFDQLNFSTVSTLTIATDAITITGTSHKVDTEASAATDNLSTINGGAQGDVLLLRTVNSARDVTLKHNVGNILTIDANDIVLSTLNPVVLLYFNGTSWIVLNNFFDRNSPGTIGGTTPGVITGTTINATKVNMAAATTGAASGNIAPGTQPTSPVEGDFWGDSAQTTIELFLAGITQSINGVLATQSVAATAVANSVAETSIFTGASFVGTRTLPANFFKVGKTIRIGVESIVGITGTPTLTIRMKLGSTTILTATSAALSAIASQPHHTVIEITCYATGASGAVRGHIWNLIGIIANNVAITTANVTVDTTASQVIDVTAQWSVANAANTIQAIITSIEVLN